MKLKWIWQPEQRFKNAWLRGAGEAGELPHFKCQTGQWDCMASLGHFILKNFIKYERDEQNIKICAKIVFLNGQG